jgi:hypothetical protein
MSEKNIRKTGTVFASNLRKITREREREREKCEKCGR